MRSNNKLPVNAGTAFYLLPEHRLGNPSAHEIIVKPLASEANLSYRAWIERNRAEVERKTGGKADYIYLPDFST